jgi:PadR family transcriptional regulator
MIVLGKGYHNVLRLNMDIGKDLVAASATPLVLAILSEGESYGYAIIKRVAELSSGEIKWTDGMLYPLLHRLERNGYVEAKWGKSETGRKRKYYFLTDSGHKELTHHQLQWQKVDSALRSIWNSKFEVGLQDS